MKTMKRRKRNQKSLYAVVMSLLLMMMTMLVMGRADEASHSTASSFSVGDDKTCLAENRHLLEENVGLDRATLHRDNVRLR